MHISNAIKNRIIGRAVAILLLLCFLISGCLGVFAKDFLVGDISGDGKIDARDDLMLTQMLLGQYTEAIARRTSDLNGDGKTNSIDSSLIKQIIVGKVAGEDTISLSVISGESWRADVLKNVNAFVLSESNDENTYAVLDFDGTAVEYSLEDIMTLYQFETMTFGFVNRREFRPLLNSMVTSTGKEMSQIMYGTTTYSKVTTTILDLYRDITNKFGALTTEGISHDKVSELIATEEWKSFVVNILNLCAACDTDIRTFCRSNMSPTLVFTTAKKAFSYFSKADGDTITIAADSLKDSGIPKYSYTFTYGVSFNKDITELCQVLKNNEIDLWICSSAEINTLRGAVDAAGLHDLCTGVIANVYTENEQKLTKEIDTETGFAFRPKLNGKWTKDITPVKTAVDDSTKALAINNICNYYYGKGPSAVFFGREEALGLASDFCDTKLAVFFAGEEYSSICSLSEYQKNVLMLSYDTAASSTTTLYCVQGDYSVQNSSIEYYKNQEMLTKDVVDYIAKDSAYHSIAQGKGNALTGDDSNKELEIKALTFNIRYVDDADGHSISERAPRIKQTITKISPDVVGFQEGTDEWMGHLIEDYGDEYEIFNLYRGYKDHESCPIMWKKDKYRCVERGAFWMSDTPEYCSGDWDPCFRICEFIVLRDIETGREFVFMNTHFGFGDSTQSKSSQTIIDYMESMYNLPAMVVGDFNMWTTWPGYETMVASLTDVNAATVNDESETFHGYYHYVEPLEHIDYCFVNDQITPLDAEILHQTYDGKYESDHYGVRFKVAIKAN